MSIGIVACNAFTKPDHAVDSKRLAQAKLDCRSIQMRVSVWIQQAGFGRDENACSIDLDCSAFEDHIAAERRDIQNRRHFFRDRIVQIPRRVLFAPAVECPASRDQVAFAVTDEDRTVIANPGVVGRDVEEADVTACACFVEHRFNVPLVLRVEDVDEDCLAGGEVAHRHRHHSLDFGQLIRPRLGVVRPRKPRRQMAFPFRRHPVTLRRGRLVRREDGATRHHQEIVW